MVGSTNYKKKLCPREREREKFLATNFSSMDTIFKFPGQLPDLITNISIECNFNPLDK